jgi:hypothetical protein
MAKCVSGEEVEMQIGGQGEKVLLNRCDNLPGCIEWSLSLSRPPLPLWAAASCQDQSCALHTLTLTLMYFEAQLLGCAYDRAEPTPVHCSDVATGWDEACGSVDLPVDLPNPPVLWLTIFPISQSQALPLYRSELILNLEIVRSGSTRRPLDRSTLQLLRVLICL